MIKVSKIFLDGLAIAISVVAGVIALVFAAPFVGRMSVLLWALWNNAMQEASTTLYWSTWALVVCAFVFWLVAVRTFSFVQDDNKPDSKSFIFWEMLSDKVAPSILVLTGALYYFSFDSLALLSLLDVNVKYAFWAACVMAVIFVLGSLMNLLNGGAVGNYEVGVEHPAVGPLNKDSYANTGLSKQEFYEAAHALKLCLIELCEKLQINWNECYESSPGAVPGVLVSLNFYESQEQQVDLLIRAFRKELASESPEAIATLGDPSDDGGHIRFAADVHKSFIFSNKYWSVDFYVRDKSSNRFRFSEDSQP